MATALGLVKIEDRRLEIAGNRELEFLPKTLTAQCQSLIESYHELHGYACLPDLLWKSGLGPFIESHRELSQWLKKAATTRSAKQAHNRFVHIAKMILSLEILASGFAGWRAIYPDAGQMASKILQPNVRGHLMPLMEFYLYPPKHMSSAAIATLAPRPGDLPRQSAHPGDRNPNLVGDSFAWDGASES
jgi:hypothetical protein